MEQLPSDGGIGGGAGVSDNRMDSEPVCKAAHGGEADTGTAIRQGAGAGDLARIDPVLLGRPRKDLLEVR